MSRATRFGMRHAYEFRRVVTDSERSSPRQKMLGISILILCVVALAAPVAAASAGFVVTDPGTLVLLGTALVGVGVCTRRLLLSRKKGL